MQHTVHHMHRFGEVAMPLIGLFLLIVQPFATTVIRLAMDELRFDGASLINIVLCALGGWILTKDWRPAVDGSLIAPVTSGVGVLND